MDVRTKNRGRPHQNVRFSAAPVMGRSFLTQGRPGVRVRNVRGKSGPKSLCLCCFFFPETGFLGARSGVDVFKVPSVSLREERFCAHCTRKPPNGLYTETPERAFSEPCENQTCRVVRSPFRGLCVQSAPNCPSPNSRYGILKKSPQKFLGTQPRNRSYFANFPNHNPAPWWSL